MNFRYRLMRFMAGRYGLDRMFYLLFGVAAVLAFLNCFVHSWILQLIVYGITFYAFFRVLSRNTYARARENRATTEFVERIRKSGETARQRAADTTHIYKKCPRCKAVLRLPRRKGKHQTVCPKCGNKFSVRVFSDPKY